MLLETIEKENDIKKIPLEQMPVLAQEIRDFLLESLSKTGGHLASNLGAVELTMRSEERRVGKECRSRWSPYH